MTALGDDATVPKILIVLNTIRVGKGLSPKCCSKKSKEEPKPPRGHQNAKVTTDLAIIERLIIFLGSTYMT